MRRTWLAVAVSAVLVTVGCSHLSTPSAGTPTPQVSVGRSPAPVVRPATSLPADGRYAVGSTVLTGHRRYVDGKRVGRSALWTTDDVLGHAGDVWAELVRSYPSTGLYPVVLQAGQTQPDDGSPWLDGAFDLSSRTAPDRVGSPAALLARLYRQALTEFESDDVPTRTLTTLPTTRSGGPALDTALRQAAGLPGRIGLVAVARPADVPYAIGWLGAANYFDGGTVTAVLRSWEDRYGAQLIRIGEDYLQVSVPNPPQTLVAARRIALEHVAFCPDQVYQEAAGFEDFAESLVGANSWYCWWD